MRPELTNVDVVTPPADFTVEDVGLGGICETSRIEINGRRFVMKTDSHGIDSLVNEWLAFKVAEALGYHFVPPTYFCRDSDWNFFTLQRFIPNASNWSNTPSSITDKVNKQKLTNIFLFDYLIQNADRHGGNMMVTIDAHPFCIDHHLVFYEGKHKPFTCYQGMQDDDYTLREFAARLLNAKEWLKIVDSNLPQKKVDMFWLRVERIITYAEASFGVALPLLTR